MGILHTDNLYTTYCTHTKINGGQDMSYAGFNVPMTQNEKINFVVALGKNDSKIAGNSYISPSADISIDASNTYSLIRLGQSTSLAQITRLLGTIDKLEIYPSRLPDNTILDLSRN
jgi:hypothetical protein